jgi:hypothetical protein
MKSQLVILDSLRSTSACSVDRSSLQNSQVDLCGRIDNSGGGALPRYIRLLQNKSITTWASVNEGDLCLQSH